MGILLACLLIALCVAVALGVRECRASRVPDNLTLDEQFDAAALRTLTLRRQIAARDNATTPAPAPRPSPVRAAGRRLSGRYRRGRFARGRK